jgi:KaiC/GvpD/RAD55 family RecA-like ATPase
MGIGDRMVGDKIQTHIEGFDELRGGGIPKGHIVLLGGAPGTMKSSLAYNILYGNSIIHNMRGAYISLEQSRASLLKHMESLGLKYKDIDKYMTIVDMAYMRKELVEVESKDSWLELFKLYTKTVKDDQGFDLLAVDSLSVLMMISQKQGDRSELFQFFEWLRNLNATVFLVSEFPRSPTNVSDEEFLADGVIHIIKERVGTVDTQLRIVIDKMRVTDHHRGFHNLTFKDKHFQISKIISE